MESGVRPPLRHDVIRHEDRWYVLATSSHADDRTRVLKDGETFGVCDRYGDIHSYGTGEQGLYHEGTRYLSRFELTLNGERPLLLNSTVKADNTLLLVDLTTPDIAGRDGQYVIRKDTLHLFRARFLWRSVQYEHLRIVNYGEAAIDVTLDIDVESDYADIFEVRGVQRAHRGRALPPQQYDGEVVLAYQGLDGVVRRTRVRFDAETASFGDGRLHVGMKLVPREARDVYLAIVCESGEERHDVLNYTDAIAQSANSQGVARRGMADVYSSNEQFNDWLDRSAADLYMLLTHTPQGAYPYAGVPWFSAPFGRDGILTAFEFLWVRPDLARGVLGFLAIHQATRDDCNQDAEPGKIVHEMRRGEMAALGEVPFGRYYGSVDSTPLFVMLAHAYYERTGDRTFVDSLWPNIERALEWIDRYGDIDGDGFVEYRRRCEHGLLQQGWKDSGDSVFHADGSLAQAPIALCEVQGYVYGAKHGAARLARLLGWDARAVELERQALELKHRFHEAFWCEEIGSYALALDGDKRQCRVRTSNAGHALFTGIASEQHAHVLADTLLTQNLFNGWGVRTVASNEQRYNPMSYHNGSVWPHDNALIAAGLARYGFPDKALRLLTGLFDASVVMDLHRLPELYCGFTRMAGHAPTLYPVACSPQAWAAGAVFLLLQACLGLSFSPQKPQLRFHHPVLPDYLQWLEIRNLRVGDGSVDLRLTRYALDVGINIIRKDGDIELAVFV